MLICHKVSNIIFFHYFILQAPFILSHSILSYLILSYLILSYLILSYLITPPHTHASLPQDVAYYQLTCYLLAANRLHPSYRLSHGLLIRISPYYILQARRTVTLKENESNMLAALISGSFIRILG